MRDCVAQAYGVWATHGTQAHGVWVWSVQGVWVYECVSMGGCFDAHVSLFVWVYIWAYMRQILLPIIGRKEGRSYLAAYPVP